jgi:hypothetical protein
VCVHSFVGAKGAFGSGAVPGVFESVGRFGELNRLDPHYRNAIVSLK